MSDDRVRQPFLVSVRLFFKSIAPVTREELRDLSILQHCRIVPGPSSGLHPSASGLGGGSVADLVSCG
jgi:hypothetical protein